MAINVREVEAMSALNKVREFVEQEKDRIRFLDSQEVSYVSDAAKERGYVGCVTQINGQFYIGLQRRLVEDLTDKTVRSVNPVFNEWVRNKVVPRDEDGRSTRRVWFHKPNGISVQQRLMCFSVSSLGIELPQDFSLPIEE